MAPDPRGAPVLRTSALVCVFVLGAGCEPSAADPSSEVTVAPAQLAVPYREQVEGLAVERAALVRRWNRGRGPARGAVLAAARTLIEDGVRALGTRWLDTAWGLGVPQNLVPGPGQINCGMFVGTVLRDAGFVVDVRKLQRQPSQLIIESFVTGQARVKKFSNASMETFLAKVRAMGPGLFIIGLDFHVGLLLQTDRDLRFLHASYVTRTVVNESAATAIPIVSSKYRVVGKLLTDDNVRDWLDGERIEVKGDW
jgi:hypothetical protein